MPNAIPDATANGKPSVVPGAGLGASSGAASEPAIDPTAEPARILILGGGFGGLYAALRLHQAMNQRSPDRPTTQPPTSPSGASRPVSRPATRPQITLVDRSDRFVFLPLLYELMTGELQAWEIAPRFTDVLAGTGIHFVQADVRSIDLDQRQVEIQSIDRSRPVSHLGYDRLVLALGGETPKDWVPGAAEFAYSFRSLEDAYRLAQRLESLEASNAEKIRVAIVGGGYSGVEIACKLADRLGSRGRLRIIEQSTQILRNAPDFNRQAADQALEQRGIWLDWDTNVRAIYADAIALDYRGTLEEIPVDAVVWTVGNRIPDLVQRLPLAKNDRGQLLTTPTLQTRDRPEVFALGDLAETYDSQGTRLPPTGQAALQAGHCLGDNLWASLTDQPLQALRYENLGEMLALGNRSATLAGLGLTLDGPLAYLARRIIYLYRMPSLQHQVKVGLNWLSQAWTEAGRVALGSGLGSGGDRSKPTK